MWHRTKTHKCFPYVGNNIYFYNIFHQTFFLSSFFVVEIETYETVEEPKTNRVPSNNFHNDNDDDRRRMCKDREQNAATNNKTTSYSKNIIIAIEMRSGLKENAS